MFEEFQNKKIAILGFGKEGRSTLNFLIKIGLNQKNITILDKNEVKLTDFFGNIIFGDDYILNLESFDLIIKSPGISPYKKELYKFKDKFLTQTKIFFKYFKGKIISVTQTKGKSTTVSIIYNLLKNAGYNVKLVGNIGNPVLDEIDLLKDNYDFIVYELSSYMLEDLDNHHSYISIIGNIYEDHLDWHLNFDNYKKAKLNILKNTDNLLVGYNLSQKIQNNLLNRKFLSFGGELSYISHIKNIFFINSEKIDINIFPLIPGEHNLDNFCGILGICYLLKIDYKIFENTINNFKGLPHRLENIGIYNGIIFIDDAISTTPESTIEGIKSCVQNIGTIFLGGTDRGYNFELLIKILIEKNIYNIVLFPNSGEKIKSFLDKKFNFIETLSMKEAVDFAFKNTKKGDICLLSTASPSYSIWKNFEQKGDEFKREVIEYKIK